MFIIKAKLDEETNTISLHPEPLAQDDTYFRGRTWIKSNIANLVGLSENDIPENPDFQTYGLSVEMAEATVEKLIDNYSGLRPAAIKKVRMEWVDNFNNKLVAITGTERN